MEEHEVSGERFEIGRSARYAIAALLLAVVLALVFWRGDTTEEAKPNETPGEIALREGNSVAPSSGTEILVGGARTLPESPGSSENGEKSTTQSNELRLEAHGSRRPPKRESLADRLSGATADKESGIPEPLSEPRIHVVRPGETAEVIARRYLGSGNSWARIEQANPGVSGDSLSPGTRLVIPWGETTSPSPEPERTSTSLQKAMDMKRGQVHIVQTGETLSSIASKHLGSSRHWRQIAEANPSLSPHRIPVGTKLYVPTKTPTAERISQPTSPRPRKETISSVAKTQIKPPAHSSGPSVQNPPPLRTHVVQKGESLYTIAKKFYGTGHQWRRIRDANDFSEDSWKVHIGQRLIIPQAN